MKCIHIFPPFQYLPTSITNGLQYSPFITSHMRGILSVAPCNFSCGKTKNYAWHCKLPRVENGLATPRNRHALRLKPLPRVTNIKAMPRASTKNTRSTVLKLIYTVLLTDNSCFTSMADAPYQLCLLWIGSRVIQLLPSSASI